MSSAIENPSAEERIRTELVRRYGLLADGGMDSSLGELGEGEERTIKAVAKAVNGLRVSGEIESGAAQTAYGVLLDELQFMPDEIRSAQSLIVEGRVRTDLARTLWSDDILYCAPDARTAYESQIARTEEIIGLVFDDVNVGERYPRAAEGLRASAAQREAMNIKIELERVKQLDKRN